MRIITGTLKGRKINIPKTLEVRPTSDRTKEGIFSIIDSRKFIRDSRVLDLFAGSGNLGFEALSRGAKSVQYVDNDRRNIQQIQKLAGEFDVSNRITTVLMDTAAFLNGPAAPYDFIFCDPPYDYPAMKEIINRILEEGWLQEQGWLILEHDKYHNFEDHPACIIARQYGRTTVTIFEYNNS